MKDTMTDTMNDIITDTIDRLMTESFRASHV